MTAVRSQREVIRGLLADLKMPGSLEAVDDVLSEVDGGRLVATEAIKKLLLAQVTLRNNRRLQAAMRSSRLPAVKTLDSFDFSFQPSIKREQIESLHELGFVECQGSPNFPQVGSSKIPHLRVAVTRRIRFPQASPGRL